MLTLLLSFSLSALQTDKQIQVSVVAPFSSSLIGETICYFGEFQKENYNTAIKTINGLKTIPKTSKEISSLFSDVIGKEDSKFLEFLLDFHYFSPRIAFYSSLGNSKNESFEFEPNYSEIVYTDVDNFKLNSLKENAVIRPISSKKGVNLNGYGVEFRPFRYSMEYGVKDNAKLQKSKAKLVSDKDREFLLENDPTGRMPSPERLRKSFLSYIYQTDDKFGTLKAIAENWPVSAEIVATETPDDDIENDVDEENIVERGVNEATLNGRLIDFETFDPFTLAKQIDEVKSTKRILEEEFSLNTAKSDIVMEQEIKEPSLIIDIRETPILWVNDLENDRRYKKYHKRLDTLFGSLSEPPKIRRNIVNIVLFVDLLDENDLALICDAHRLIEKGYAARLGIVPLSTQENYSMAMFDIFEEGRGFKFMSTLAKTGNIEGTIRNFTKEDYKSSAEAANFVKESGRRIEEMGIDTHALWVNGDLYTNDDLGENLLYAPMEAVKTIRELITDQREIDNFLDLVLTKKKAVKRRIEEIHIDKPIIVPLSSASYEKGKEFVEFMKNIKYQQSDDEQAIVTVLAKVRNNKEEIENAIEDFFNEKHRTPVRFAFVSKFPSIIEDDIVVKSGSSNTDATLFVNGRILNINSTFNDYNDLFEWESIIPQQLKVHAMTLDDDRATEDLLCYWSAYSQSLLQREIHTKHYHPNIFDSESPAVVESECDADVHLKFIMNPFTREFQKMIGFINKFKEYGIADISLRLNTPQKLSAVPTSFYRYVTEDKALISIFNDSITYSVIMEPPETWVIEQMRADVDLDNVLSRELSPGAYIGEYALANIVVEGSAVNEKNKVSDGVQILIKGSDTTIMKMNGYWQLKANPGLFPISLVDGWSSRNYKIMADKLVVSSFVWERPTIVVIKRGDEKRTFDAKDDGKIHIFGVSSGHLYERLTKIMILSAVKNSVNATCKFWLLKNYMSPSFKQTLPLMAEEYNFEYELVTYHWPHWIQRQTEKQRIIWGNKILFLDVLFPLSLKRVIYVDADQVIRTNMRQLMEMDFKDAPYAFTPMCGSRIETEPFRFWKIGYWKDHLKGKPYHISALFAIDLNRFRETDAGDLLRFYYSQLVKDPASLSNLDQDLPNYAQDKIPIFSLPQNWLWCETWCSDDTMDNAKTIDLCNNPLTKAPKLEIAQTRIKEWPQLDKEAKAIEERFKHDEEL